MTSEDTEYAPSTWDWVAEQVAEYEASDGARANTLRATGIPIIVMTTRGVKSGKIRKVPLMRVEHNGQYALIASKGGAPAHPGWYHNLKANNQVQMQDGPAPWETEAHIVTGNERAEWWERAVAVYPPYADYEVKAADREIPVFVTAPRLT